MQEKRISGEAPAGGAPAPKAERDVDDAVLGLLLHSRGPGLWAMEEIVRELGDGGAVEDSVGRLVRAGLVHHSNGFVLASRAAVEYDRICS